MLTELEKLIDRFIETHLKNGRGNSLGKLQEEVKEFIDDPSLGEGADVLICVMIELRKRRLSLDNLITATYHKMYVNLARTWEIQEDGTLHHVTNDEPVFCDHEPYRADTEILMVVLCRKCPAAATVHKMFSREPVLPRYLVGESRNCVVCNTPKTRGPNTSGKMVCPIHCSKCGHPRTEEDYLDFCAMCDNLGGPCSRR